LIAHQIQVYKTYEFCLAFNCPFEKAVNDVADSKPETYRFYHQAYQVFVRYFATFDRITSEQLIIGAHFTYGWMPRLLILHGDSADDHYGQLSGLCTGGVV